VSNLSGDEVLNKITKLLGCVLSKNEILERIRSPNPLVTGYIDLEKQLQPAGFEFTLNEIESFMGSGVIDFSNEKRRLSKLANIELSEDKPVTLPQGAFLLRYNETVHLPRDILALIFPRSSLIRNGTVLHTAVWDPGYEGRGQGLLCVHNPHGLNLYKNARIGQMVFIKLGTPVSEGYHGIFQREGLV
jgi:dUTP pyrophosphatase